MLEYKPCWKKGDSQKSPKRYSIQHAQGSSYSYHLHFSMHVFILNCMFETILKNPHWCHCSQWVIFCVFPSWHCRAALCGTGWFSITCPTIHTQREHPAVNGIFFSCFPDLTHCAYQTVIWPLNRVIELGFFIVNELLGVMGNQTYQFSMLSLRYYKDTISGWVNFSRA